MPIDKLDFNYKYVMTVQHNLNVLHLLSFVQQVSKYSKCLEHKWYFGMGENRYIFNDILHSIFGCLSIKYSQTEFYLLQVNTSHHAAFEEPRKHST